MEVTLDPKELRDWMPIRFYPDADGQFVDWCHVGRERFIRPFFEDTINVCLRRPFNLLFRHQTPIEFLGEIYDRSPGIRPTGFIFHASRCGSTLVSQMLASMPSSIVISEAPPIDSILRTETRGSVESSETRVRWLKWMVNAFGQKRHGSEEKHLFIKFDSWSTLSLDLVRTAFPDVPWIFLYRNPIEIIVSHMDQRGVHMIPGVIPGLLHGITTSAVMQMPHEEYCARVLKRICRSAIDNAIDAKGLFLNYSSLPGAVTVIAEHFGLKLSTEDLERVGSVARYNAKTPQMEFEPDSVKKNRAASAKARAAAVRWVEPVYHELESLKVSARSDD